jgi:DNA-binding transcriptional MerR regulator
MGKDKELMSIGELLKSLIGEFPDLTISKIRFLESEGLLNPERTPSGYRKFSQLDAQRLRFILRLQKERYLPLKVIKEKLREIESGRIKASDLASGIYEEDERLKMEGSAEEATLLKQNVQEALGIPMNFVNQLEEHKLVCSHQGEDGEYYEREDIKIIRIAHDFSRYGIEPRHLRMYKNLTDREEEFFESLLFPLLRQKDPEAKRTAVDNLIQLTNLSRELKDLLLKNRVKPYLKQLDYKPLF